MINKMMALTIRLGVTFLIAVIIGAIVYSNGGGAKDAHIMVGWLIGLIGVIYSTLNFNNHYNFGIASKADNQINGVIDKKNKLQTEDEMLRIKNLLDQGILTKDEYDKKINSLKEKYL